jgi:hypothetical protein
LIGNVVSVSASLADARGALVGAKTLELTMNQDNVQMHNMAKAIVSGCGFCDKNFTTFVGPDIKCIMNVSTFPRSITDSFDLLMHSISPYSLVVYKNGHRAFQQLLC